MNKYTVRRFFTFSDEVEVIAESEDDAIVLAEKCKVNIHLIELDEVLIGDFHIVEESLEEDSSCDDEGEPLETEDE